MTIHEQYAEELALYALGSLEGGESASLERHLSECASCRRELEQLRGDAALLALTTSGPMPPARSKARLMNAIAQEPRTRAKLSHPWWSILGWVTTAALVGLVAVLWIQNARLRSNAIQLTRFAEQQKLQLEKSGRVAEILNAQDAQPVTLLPVNTKAVPPVGRVIYSRQRGGLVFIANNLLPVPSQKAYELWLIPVRGAPIPAGVFRPDSKGSAVVANPPLPTGVQAKAFAITIEPDQGSAAPTMPIVMQGGV